MLAGHSEVVRTVLSFRGSKARLILQAGTVQLLKTGQSTAESPDTYSLHQLWLCLQASPCWLGIGRWYRQCCALGEQECLIMQAETVQLLKAGQLTGVLSPDTYRLTGCGCACRGVHAGQV